MLDDFAPVSRGDVLRESELDDFVCWLITTARDRGFIPIAAVVSRLTSDGRHEILGFGNNQLRRGIPGIHGETAAVMDAGLLPAGYRAAVITTSLCPCTFCRRTLGDHLGVRRVRVLDASGFNPQGDGAEHGITLEIRPHAAIIDLFANWLRDPANRVIWDRDIGLWHENAAPPVDWDSLAPSRRQDILHAARQAAADAHSAGEAPIGALILDRFGEILSAAHGRIFLDNDPTMTPAMAAWRKSAARDHWRDKTLVLTSGPDAIALAMFEVFRFGRLVLLSNPDPIQAKRVQAIGSGGGVVKLLGEEPSDDLRAWLAKSPQDCITAYLGAGATVQ